MEVGGAGIVPFPQVQQGLVDARRARFYPRGMDMLGWGLLTIGMLWFLAATFVGGARSLMLSAGLFVLGVVLYAYF
jgi:hypothetical protein